MFKYKGRKFLVGVDPSTKKMGAAIWNPTTKKLFLKSGHILDVIPWIQENVPLSEIYAVIEDPVSAAPAWHAQKQIESMIKNPKKYNQATMKSILSSAMMTSQRVGKVKEAFDLTFEMFKRSGVPVILFTPAQRDKAFLEVKQGSRKTIERREVTFLKMPTKTTQAQFKQLTGYDKSSSEDARDAATLVFDRSVKWAELEHKTQLIKREAQAQAREREKERKRKERSKKPDYVTTSDESAYEYLLNSKK